MAGRITRSKSGISASPKQQPKDTNPPPTKSSPYTTTTTSKKRKLDDASPKEDAATSTKKPSSKKQKQQPTKQPDKRKSSSKNEQQQPTKQPDKKKSSSKNEQQILTKQSDKNNPEEKRLKPFRKQAPQSFLQKLERATSQRMIVIDRARAGSGEDLHENINVVGTTGNIYTVTISRVPSCTCPDSQKGNECKHKVYVLGTVLRASFDLQYQRAFLTSELEEILANAPPIPDISGDNDEDRDGKRKPIEGECPICYMDFDPDHNELVWCKAACGNNMHKDCFQQWAASQRGKEVRCVYCRAPWEMDKGDFEAVKNAGVDSGDGYVNVAEQFGISRVRDYSTYHRPWVRRNFGYR